MNPAEGDENYQYCQVDKSRQGVYASAVCEECGMCYRLPKCNSKKGGMEAMAHAPRIFQGSSTMVLKTSNIAIRTETGITSMLMRSAGSAANALLRMDPP
jgi:hypothetical protein